MMTIRTIVTPNSIWKFDLDAMIYVRIPKAEAPRATRIKYTAEWEPFTAVEQDGDRIVVHRPVPWGTGARRMSGPVVHDSHAGAPWPDVDAAREIGSQNAGSGDDLEPLERAP